MMLKMKIQVRNISLKLLKKNSLVVSKERMLKEDPYQLFMIFRNLRLDKILEYNHREIYTKEYQELWLQVSSIKFPQPWKRI